MTLRPPIPVPARDRGSLRFLRRLPWRPTAIAAAFLASAAMATRAAVPVLDQLHPVGLQAGTTRDVTAVGKFEPWPVSAWVSGEGVRVEVLSDKGALRVVVATNAVPGPRWVRLFNAEGASAPRFLVVADGPQADEAEPNDDFRNPQVVTNLPCSLNGRLEKTGDVDSYAVDLAAGSTLVAAVEAHVLMSPVDAVLRVLDPDGRQAAWNHDDGRTFDPFLAFTATRPGRHVVQVFGFAYPADSDIRFTGNAKCTYRLHLTTGPALSHVTPLGVRRGARTRLTPSGWNLGTEGAKAVEFDGAVLAEGVDRNAWRPDGFHRPFELAVGDGPEGVEIEPNNTQAEAQPMSVPGAVTGDLNPTEDVDRFRFAARKGQRYAIAVRAAGFGFPLDSWLQLEAPDGRNLVRKDDVAGSDPRIEWTAAADETLTVVVGNLLHRGGTNLLYRLSVEPDAPHIEATVADHAFTLAAGATNELKVSLRRLGGHEGPVRLVAEGLPQGVSLGKAEAGAKDSEILARLVASTNAAAFQGPVRLRVEPEGTAKPTAVAVRHELVSSGENNGVPQGFRRLVVESVEALWLTVTVPKAESDGKTPPKP